MKLSWSSKRNHTTFSTFIFITKTLACASSSDRAAARLQNNDDGSTCLVDMMPISAQEPLSRMPHLKGGLKGIYGCTMAKAHLMWRKLETD